MREIEPSKYRSGKEKMSYDISLDALINSLKTKDEKTIKAEARFRNDSHSIYMSEKHKGETDAK